MKETFKGFYQPTNEDLGRIWVDPETIFIFDTHILLNIYGYAEQTREDFFSALNYRYKDDILL